METTLQSSNASLGWSSDRFANFKVRLQQYRTYRETVRELSALTDRALADLGLSRSMIKGLAREVAYGG